MATTQTVVATPQAGQNGQADLKRLAFVPEVAEKAVNTASSLYSTSKTYVPASLKPRLDGLEEQVGNLSAPYVAKAQDTSSELLKTIDQKVDTVVGQAQQVYQSNTSYLQQQLEKQKQFHAANLESYRAAREQYLKKVEDSVDFLKQHGLTGAAKAAADEVGAKLADAQKLPGYLIHQVQEAVHRLLAFPPVSKLLETARPQLDAAYATYAKLHDNVVASPRYKQAYDLSLQVLGRVQASSLYQTAATRLYPVVQPYADPAYAKVVSSPYYQLAVEQLKPKVHAA